MGASEELSQINSALTHCTQLKTQLNSTLLHIQRLNAKYNQTDYMAVIRNLDNYRRSSSITTSPYPKQRQRDDRSNDESNNSYRSTSTSVKRPSMFRRKQFNNTLTSTPKSHRKATPNQAQTSHLMDESFEMCQSDFNDTPKRTVREMKENSNTISVRTIKVQRNIEAIITHLEVMQRSHKKRKIQQMEQSLYQSCSNSSFGSPGHVGHTHCMDQSFSSVGSSFGGNDSVFSTSSYHTPTKHVRSIQYDRDQRTLEKLQRFYATPLQRMHKRLAHLNASLVSAC